MSIFGSASELPRAVDENDLVATKFDRGEYIDYEPVKDDPTGFNLSDMLSDNIDEELKRMESGNEGGGEGPTDTFKGAPDGAAIGDGDMSLDLDDLDAEMMAEMWNDLRVSLHSGLYDWAIYKQPKKAKQILRDLSMKDNKTAAEKALVEELWKYTDKHDELRSEYMGAVPYSEKQQALMVRFIEYQINRMRMQGRSFPKWLMWAYLFVVPEVQMGVKFIKIKSEVPEFNFDYEQFQRQQNGSKK